MIKRPLSMVYFFLPNKRSLKTWGKSFHRFKRSLHRPSKFFDGVYLYFMNVKEITKHEIENDYN